MTEFSSYSALAQVGVEAALQAGKLLRAGFGSQLEIFPKTGVQDFATNYDHASEKLLIEAIHSKYPQHGFLAEESGASAHVDADMIWVIDPLDGTANFARHIPLFTVSLGVVQRDEVICGITYQPMSDELFVAEKGRGAYLNGKRLSVSKTQKFAEGICVTGIPHHAEENPLHCLDHLVTILKQGTLVRNLGSAALNLAYVAAGRFDAFWGISLQPWDVAAGILLIEEAGGRVSHYQGIPYSVLSGQPLVASNGGIHEQVLNILQSSF
jgi:myo-inositol-1(or 4)-monophosphatase